MAIVWVRHHPRATTDMLGYLPEMLDATDPRSAKEQFNANYLGGWNSFVGFELDMDKGTINYPGDPPTKLLYWTILRREWIGVFEHAWVVIVQEDNTWDAARLD